MKRKTRKALKLTAEHAANALGLLIADGKLTAKDVTNALKRREQVIRDLRQRLAALEQGVVSAVERTGRKIARRATRKAKRRMTAARRSALRLHGKYLGHIRTLSKANRAKVKAIRETKGVYAAIRAARNMGKSS